MSYFAPKLWLYVMIWLPQTTDNSKHFAQSLEIRGIESRLYLLFCGEYQYISSSAVKRISIFHECVAQVKLLIFSPHEIKYIWYLPKKVNFPFILYSTEIQKAQPNFSLFVSLNLTFFVCLLGITLGVNKFAHKKWLSIIFYDRNTRNQPLKKGYRLCLRIWLMCKLALHQVKQ